MEKEKNEQKISKEEEKDEEDNTLSINVSDSIKLKSLGPGQKK